MAKMKEGLGEVFTRAPLSTRTFQQFPSIYGGEDPSALQYVNRAVSQLPLDAIDIIGRLGEGAMFGTGALASEIYQGLGGSETMGERLGRDIYGLGQAVAPLIGVSPSSLSGARYPSASRAATSDPALARRLAEESGIAATAKEKPQLKGPTDKYLALKAEQDKRSSATGREYIQEEMDEEALLDILRDVRDDIDDDIMRSLDEPMYESYVDGPFGISDRAVYMHEDDLTNADVIIDTLQDSILGTRGEDESMGEAISRVLDEELPSFEERGFYMSSDDLIDKIAARADDVYGMGLRKAVKRKKDAEANQRALRTQLGQAKAKNRQIEREARQAEFEKSLGITDEMPFAERDAIIEEYIRAQERDIAGAGLPPIESPKPNLRVVIDNTEDME